MSGRNAGAPGFWPTVRLLLGVSLRRSIGRQRRQRQLLRQRAGEHSINWGGWGYAPIFAGMALFNGLAGVVLSNAVMSGERIAFEPQGRIIVEDWFRQGMSDPTNQAPVRAR